jgi:predicted nuclease of predicted toxin-antitoxin system
MVEPVVRLINGRGYRIRRARDVGLADEDDQTLVEYCLNWELVLITFDADLRDKALRGRCRVLHIKTPERSARDRLAMAIDEVVRFLARGSRLVTVRRNGTVDAGR